MMERSSYPTQKPPTERSALVASVGDSGGVPQSVIGIESTQWGRPADQPAASAPTSRKQKLNQGSDVRAVLPAHNLQSTTHARWTRPNKIRTAIDGAGKKCSAELGSINDRQVALALPEKTSSAVRRNAQDP